MDESIAVSLRDQSQYRSEALAATAFNQPPQRRRTSKYSTFFKKRQSHCISKSIDSEADRETCQQLATEGDLEGLKSALESLEVTLKGQDASGASLLHCAARGNQVEVMRYLIESGIAPDSRDDKGNTVLHVAVREGSVDAVHVLLNSGASDSILNSEQEAAIHLAVKLNRIDVVEALLDHPIDLLVRGYRKRTALHLAAELDRVEVCKMVHKHAQTRSNGNFKLCVADEDDLTPSHLAARKGSHRVLSFFMEVCRDHGYPNETILSFLDEENSTPLHAAIDGGHAAVVDVLLKHGASPLDSKYGQPPPVHMACSQGKLDMVQIMVNHCGPAILHKEDEHGRTPLHFSANSMRSEQLISYITQYDANVNATDDQNRTALHIAVMSGSLTAVQKLLSKGADPIISDHCGHNALHYAVIHRRKAIINCLVELPCAQQLTLDNSECTPVHCALKLGYGDLLIPLISVFGDYIEDMRDSKANNLLHLAAGSDDSTTLESLFTLPACSKLLNEVNERGGTPLHCAASSGSSRCVKILLEHGATSHKCHSGATPFMVACLKGKTVCAKLLHQAFSFQKDWTCDDGNTSLHLAVIAGSHETVKLALDMGIQIVHNFNEESFFDLIIKKADTKCALAAINHDRWQECLDLTSPHSAHPMIGLILRMPNVAKHVLDRCQVTSTLDKAHREYWESFSFKYVRLQSVKQGHPDSHADDPVIKSNSHFDTHSDTALMTNLLIPSINYKGSIKRSGPIEPIANPHLHSTQVLQAMVKYNSVSLLTHPVVQGYLRAKWSDYGRIVYYSAILVHLLHILFLSIFVACVPLPTDSRDANFVSDENGSTNLTQADYQLTPAANGIRVMTLLLCTINVIPFVAYVPVLRIKGFACIQSAFNVAHFGTILSTYVFLIPSTPLWPAGAIATFCGWFAIVSSNIMGLYGTMFLRICRTVLTVMTVSFILLLSFSLSLHLLAFAMPDFSNIGYSLFSTFGYMLGEIQYNQIVTASISGSFKFGALVFIFIITLAILMSIVMVNLLIGLAVGDIEKIRLNATAEAVTTEIQLFIHIDAMLPTRIRERYDRHSYKTQPNAYRSKLFKYINIAFQNLKKIFEEHGEIAESKDQCNQAAELAAIRQELVNLTSMVKDLSTKEQTRNRLTHRLDSIASEQSFQDTFPASSSPWTKTMNKYKSCRI